jgi:hypothetical protein
MSTLGDTTGSASGKTQKVLHEVQRVARAFCAAVPGSVLAGTSVPRTAAATILSTVSTSSVFVLCVFCRPGPLFSLYPISLSPFLGRIGVNGTVKET